MQVADNTVVTRNKTGWLSRAVLLLSVALYLWLATYQLDLPGLYDDEALDAVPAMQFLRGQPLDIAYAPVLLGRPFPVMVMSYVGATTTHLLLGPFALLGVSVQTLRGTHIALGALTLLLVWGFLAEYLDARAAGVATLLLAANPTYVFWSRMGAFVSFPLLPLAVLTLWALYRWYRRRAPGYLLLAAFCLGLGLSTKILFAWVWAFLALAWLVCSPRLRRGAGWRAWRWPFDGRLLPWWAIIGSVLAAATGAWMILAYNLHDLGTLKTIASNLGRTQLYGVNNLDLLANLRTVFSVDLLTLLDGRWFAKAWGGRHVNPLAAPALGLSLVALLWLGVKGRLRYSPLRLALLALYLATVAALSAITISSLGAPHLLIAWPAPQALTAAALLAVVDAWSARPRAPAWLPVSILSICTLTLAGAEGWTTWRYHQTLAQTGGAGNFSDAGYALSQDLQAPGALPAAALDWGLRRNVQLLTQGQVNPQEAFDYSQNPGQRFRDWLDRRIVEEGPALYLAHAPEVTNFAGHLEALDNAAYHHRLQPVLAKTYTQRDGAPVIYAYRLEPVPRLWAAPPLSQTLDVRLGDDLRLLGYQRPTAAPRAGGELRLTLYWQARRTPSVAYKVFVHLTDGGGRVLAQHDGQPVYWGYPMTAWAAGEVVADRIRLPLQGLAAGIYHLRAGLYEEASGARLSLWQDGQRAANDMADLGEVTLAP